MKVNFLQSFLNKELVWLGLLVTVLVAASSFLYKPVKKAKPVLFIIGDSTVKANRGNGEGGLWGWGSFLPAFFDTTRIKVENHALWGTSSRTFRTQGHWAKVLSKIQPGDFVLMQFGHNDSSPVNDTLRARGTIKSNGEETEEIENLITKQHEVVHSYGWYIRQFVKDVKAKKGVPIVLSPIPRSSWQNGKVNRATEDYGKWAADAANQEQVTFINLNQLIADHYDAIGEAAVKSTYFNSTDHTHTIEAGARLNAKMVATGIKKAKDCSLRKYLSKAALYK